jgi:hypothetical protein
MIPIRIQDARPGSTPATLAIIAVNALVFGYELMLGPAVNPFVMRYGLIPYRLVYGLLEAPWAVWRWAPTLVTHMFIHGGWVHILGNMWFLYVFGRCLEKRVGNVKMMAFYLGGGIAAALVQVLSHLGGAGGGTAPMVGASGAVAAVLGGFLVLGPLRPVLVLVLLIFIPLFIELPAAVVLVLWFFEQLFAGALSLTARTGQAAAVAWWAHVGGFVAGYLLMRFAFRPQLEHRKPPQPKKHWQATQTRPRWRYGTDRARMWRPHREHFSPSPRPEGYADGDVITVYDKWGRPVARYTVREPENRSAK